MAGTQLSKLLRSTWVLGFSTPKSPKPCPRITHQYFRDFPTPITNGVSGLTRHQLCKGGGGWGSPMGVSRENEDKAVL